MDKRIFEVSGNGSFPFELLCLESCYPQTSVDAEKVRLNSGNPRTLHPIKIRLVSTGPFVVKHGPTKSMWELHGWTVTDSNVSV